MICFIYVCFQAHAPSNLPKDVQVTFDRTKSLTFIGMANILILYSSLSCLASEMSSSEVMAFDYIVHMYNVKIEVGKVE